MKKTFFLHFLLFTALYFVLTSGACVDLISFTSPSSVVSGKDFQAVIAAKNKMPDYPYSFPVYTHLSADSMYNPEDIVVGEVFIDGLPPLNIVNLNLTCRVPAQTSGGWRYLIGRTDRNRDGHFDFEDLRVNRVYIEGPAVTGTDLTITNIRINGQHITPGQQVSGKFLVHNQGPVACGQFRVRCRLNTGAQTYGIQDFIIPSMGPYSTREYGVSLCVPGDVPPGAHTLVFLADILNQIAESNETNNVLSVSPFHVAELRAGDGAGDRAAAFTEPTVSSVSLSPNPAHADAYISGEASPGVSGTLQLHNMMGGLMHTATVQTDAVGRFDYTLDVRTFPAGVYYVSVQWPGQKITGKKLEIKN